MYRNGGGICLDKQSFLRQALEKETALHTTLDDFKATAYDQLFESKHHYDNLSWLIGGILLLFVGAMLAYMPTIKFENYGWQVLYRSVLGGFILTLLWTWYNIYQRNRFWVEAANEAIRDFERQYGVRGAGVAFMEATLQKTVLLKNINEKSAKIADPTAERLSANSMHKTIPLICVIVSTLTIVACLLP